MVALLPASCTSVRATRPQLSRGSIAPRRAAVDATLARGAKAPTSLKAVEVTRTEKDNASNRKAYFDELTAEWQTTGTLVDPLYLPEENEVCKDSFPLSVCF